MKIPIISVADEGCSSVHTDSFTYANGIKIFSTFATTKMLHFYFRFHLKRRKGFKNLCFHMVDILVEKVRF